MRLLRSEAWWLAAFALFVSVQLSFGQASSTVNGRVLDQGDAVLPGVTVTVTNQATGVVRTAVTNENGVYFMPGLDPGTYNVATDLAGFAGGARNNVAVGINATLTIDFTMALAGLQESLTVTGAAPLIEVTQSKVASSIEATELQNLPMVSRMVSGMLALLPGAVQIEPVHRSKANVGSVSFGGSAGANVIPSVDGADNRDNQVGGALVNFSTEALEQFQLATSQFNAADGRTAGAALTMVTKSGTNVFHGTAFGFGRSDTLANKDFFTRQANREKLPFSRQQYGGSIGGPLLRNRAFFFGAVERIAVDSEIPVPANLFAEKQVLLDATNRGLIPRGHMNPNNPTSVQTPVRLLMPTVKVNVQVNNEHSLMMRYAGVEDTLIAGTFVPQNDNSQPERTEMKIWSAVGQHNWVLGNRGLNQFTFQRNNLSRLSETTWVETGEDYVSNFPNVAPFPARLAFPSVLTGAGGSSGSITDTSVLQLKNEVSLQQGTHALKFGVNYNRLGNVGLLNGTEHYATVTFFDDPSTIMTNRNGRYPQGFQTPGIIRQWNQGTLVLGDSLIDAHQIATWVQDDWRINPRLTLNLGLRYDVDLNFYDQGNYDNNVTRQVLEAIGNPNAGKPTAPLNSVSPRFGFAYDLGGDGRRVLRGGGGIYFDQFNINPGNISDTHALNKRPLSIVALQVNTAIGVGELANFRFGIDPLPPQPADLTTLPRNSTGLWLSPDLKNPRNYQGHVGYAHQLGASTSLSVDFTHVEGRNEFRRMNINPIVNGRRVLADDFMRVYGVPNTFGNLEIFSSINQSRYQALTFKMLRRLPRMNLQVHHTIARAYAYGGLIAARAGAFFPQSAFEPFGPGEWGPTAQDERHRFVAMGVFDVPYGIQISPVFQAATPRPYNLTAGLDLNADGTNNDRWVDPSTGRQVGMNSQRGDPTFVFDVRTTKFIEMGGARRLGLFAEFFNVLNTVNHGAAFNGNGRSAAFRQPTGFVPGIGYPRQVQLGARFLF